MVITLTTNDASQQDQSWTNHNETLVLDPQKFWKKLHSKKFSEIFCMPPDLQK